jgi:hypothetical protein
MHLISCVAYTRRSRLNFIRISAKMDVLVQDAIRSLVISYKLLGTKEWFVIHHSDCGMEFFTDEVIRGLLANSLETAALGPEGFYDVGKGPGSKEGDFIDWLTIKNRNQADSTTGDGSHLTASATILQLANSRRILCQARWNGLLLGHNDLPNVISATSSESDDSSDISASDTEESDGDTNSTAESTNNSHYTTATDVTGASSSDVTHLSSSSDESDPDSDDDDAPGGQAVGVHHANQNAYAIPIAAARIRRREPP